MFRISTESETQNRYYLWILISMKNECTVKCIKQKLHLICYYDREECVEIFMCFLNSSLSYSTSYFDKKSIQHIF